MQLEAESSSNTRARLLAKAAQRVHLQGFFNTSLDEIASDANIAKATIYHHFKSKEDLGRALIDYHTSRYLQFLHNEIFKPALPGLVRLQRLCEYTVQEFSQGDLEKGCPICNLVSELSNGNDGFRAQLDAFFNSYRQLISQALLAAQSTAALRVGVDIDNLAALFLAQIQGAILLARTTIQRGDSQRGAQQLQRNFQAFFDLIH